MWGYFSFVFLFMFVGSFQINLNLIHLNEIFNSFSHSYVATLVVYEHTYQELVFDQSSTHLLVESYFAENINSTLKYDYEILFYYDEGEVTKYEIANNFTINLKGNVGFFVMYDKTFRYYIVQWRN